MKSRISRTTATRGAPGRRASVTFAAQQCPLMVENASRVGTASAVDSQQTRTVAAASLTASAGAIRKWLESGGTEDLADLMSRAFDALRAEYAA
jgi:hypothetical protein